MAKVYKIHPALGIARIGNAPDEFFIGPESADEAVHPPGGFKDGSCRVKRQAARFYIYEHDTTTLAEIDVTSQIESITWRFVPVCGKSRHFQITAIFDEVEITGRLARSTAALHIQYGSSLPDVVTVAELRSDDEGRLVLLGGFGATAATPGSNAPLASSSNDLFWYDDICEGRIEATFQFNGDQQIYAWAVVAPPRSSPHEPPSYSLYDLMKDQAVSAGFAIPPASPGTAAALDKAQLAFVSGDPFPGLEASLAEVLALYPAQVPADDPFRVPTSSTNARFTKDLPNPWQIDDWSCSWGVWDHNSSFSDAQDFLLHWPRQGIRIKKGATFVVTEQCDADVQVTLLTQTLDFGQVPVGPGGMAGQALLPIVFEVMAGNQAVELVYDTAPAVPFARGTVDPAAVGPNPGHTFTVRFWIRYTTTVVGHTDEMTVVIRWQGTTTTWPILIHAETVARRVTATALILDRSGSMAEEVATGVTKYESLQSAAGSYLDLALDGDFIQLVRYDDDAQAIPLMSTSDGLSGTGLSELGAATRSALTNIVTDNVTFAPAGSTSIGAGILTGRDRLNGAPATTTTGDPIHRAMVILTDGVENTLPMVSSVASSIDVNTYAIGLGTRSNTSAAVLQTLAGNNGGYLLVTGAITGEKVFILQKYFLQILAGINKAEIALDPSGLLLPGDQVAIPFFVTELESGFEVVALSSAPAVVDFRLMTPAAHLIEPWQGATDPGVTFGLTPRLSYFRVALPAEARPGVFEKAGRWHALLSLGRPRLQPPVPGRDRIVGSRPSNPTGDSKLRDERAALLKSTLSSAKGVRRGLPYSLLVNAYSSAALRASLEQHSFEPGATIAIRAALLDSGALPIPASLLSVEVTGPGDSIVTLPMTKVEHAPGHYRLSFAAETVGVYTCRVRATAKSQGGHALAREQTLTAAVWRGGDRDPNQDSSATAHQCQCDLLRCWLGPRGVLGGPLRAEVARLGIDLERVEQCLAECCARGTSPEALSRELELAFTKRKSTP